MTTYEPDPMPDRLRAAVSALPRDVPPADDGWPAIRARIESARVVPLPGSGRVARRPSLPWRLVTAAAVLVLVTSAITMRAVRREAPRAAAVSAPSTSGMLRLVNDRRKLVIDVCNNYDAAASDLEGVLRERRSRLSPATVRVLEESLRAIDQAIREARAVLEADPASQDMLDLLDSVYRQKLDLLRRANALPLRSS